MQSVPCALALPLCSAVSATAPCRQCWLATAREWPRPPVRPLFHTGRSRKLHRSARASKMAH
eukprot:6401902-Pyramimonas_sp.AAC.1